MPLGLQAKLLQVLQEREVERVGGKKPVALDIRVLATSNRDMQKEVAAGRFREDLYYRLNVFPIAIPALRERPGDIVPLARHFLAQHAARLKRPARLSPEAEALLVCYPWPGNVRELENTLHRVLILTPGDSVGPERSGCACRTGAAHRRRRPNRPLRPRRRWFPHLRRPRLRQRSSIRQILPPSRQALPLLLRCRPLRQALRRRINWLHGQPT